MTRRRPPYRGSMTSNKTDVWTGSLQRMTTRWRVGWEVPCSDEGRETRSLDSKGDRVDEARPTSINEHGGRNT